MIKIYQKMNRPSGQADAQPPRLNVGWLGRAILKRKIMVFSVIFLIITLPIFFLVTKYQPRVEAAWMNDNWLYRTGLTIGNTGAADSDKKVKFDIDTATLITAGKMQTDCGDSRFTDMSGRALKYFIDSSGGACNTNSTDYYVLVPTINAGNTVLYHYYGNPSAQNGTVSTQFSQATFSPTSGPTGASEENGAAPAAYWKFDEGYGTNAQDSTTNNNNGTISGSTWQSEDKCISGKCIYFDGSNDVVTVSNTVAGIKTVSFWVRPITTSEQFIDLNGSAYIQASSGTISATGFTSPTIYVNGQVSSTIVANKWQYVTVTTGTGLSGSAIKVGQISTNYGQGFFDDVKIYNYARTAAQIKSDFASKGSGSVKGTAASLGSSIKNLSSLSDGLVGYWKMDEASWVNNCSSATVTDSSGNGINGLACPATTGPTGGAAGKFGNAGSFDNSNDNISLSNLNVNTSAGGKNTVSFWMYWNGVETKMPFGMTLYDLFLYSSCFGFNTAESNVFGMSSTGLANRWAHVTAVFYNGVPNSTDNAIYIDGVKQTIYACKNNTTQSRTVATTAKISGWTTDSGYIFGGSLDEFRIYNRELSGKEVRDLYNWAPGPVGYWNMDEKVSGNGQTLYDISNSGNNGTTYWGANVSGMNCTKPGKFGSGCDFDGTDDYVDLGSPDILDNIPVKTVSFWTKLDAQVGYGNVGSHWINKGDSSGGWFISTDPGNSRNIYGQHFGVGNPGRWSFPQFSTGQWHYITVTYDRASASNDPQIFVDGMPQTVTEYSTPTGSAGDDSANNLFVSKSPGYDRWVDGFVDDVKIYNYARTSGQITEDMNAGHPIGGSPIGSQIGYWKFDEGQGSTANNSGNGSSLNGSITGATWSNSGKFNKGLSFAGGTDSVSVSNITGVQTVSFWVNPSTNSQSLLALTASAYISASSGTITATGFTAPTIYVNGKVSSTLTASVWQHVLVTTGTSITASALTIGRANSSSLTGTIDEVKIYNSALTSDEVKIDYNHGSAMVLGSVSTDSTGAVADNSSAREYCVPGDTTSCSAPIGEWKMDEGSGASAQDSSGGGSTGTITGATYQAGKIGKALNFNAGTDVVTVSNSLSTKTVEFWVYPTTTTQNLIDLRTDATAANISVSSGTISATGFTSPTIYVNGKVSSTLSAGSWQHVTITTGTAVTANAIRFGRISTTSLTGKLDLIRIFDYARSAAQIAWDYNRGGPVGWWKMDECQGVTAYDASGNANNGTITIGATGTNTSAGTCTGSAGEAWKDGATGKYNSSLEFDGTDDYVDLGTKTIWDLTTYSISGWFKTSDKSDYKVITSKNSDYNNRNWWVTIWKNGAGTHTDGSVVFRTSSGGALNVDIESGKDAADGQWHNFVAVLNGTTEAKLYIDGVLKATQNSPGVPDTPSTSVIVGNGPEIPGRYFNGQIDDVRVYNYALTPLQIKSLYNQGAAVQFAPSTGSP